MLFVDFDAPWSFCINFFFLSLYGIGILLLNLYIQYDVYDDCTDVLIFTEYYSYVNNPTIRYMVGFSLCLAFIGC